MILFIIAVHTLFASVRCSKIIEEHHQNIIQYNDYCPNFQTCREGTHVMCMYYNRYKKWGPRCLGSQNVSITPERADRILGIVNGIRARAALGIETEFDGELLPRGYGIYRLEWDPELATFAQLWSDQCSLDKDKCRATKKFPDPGQVAGMNRFTVNDWRPISKNFQNYFDDSGFHENRVNYAIDRILRSIYVAARSVIEPEHLKRAPGLRAAVFPYLQLIYGPATHIGCGVTTFSEYYLQEGASTLFYNVIRMVCNLSSRIDTGMPAYTMTPPKEPGWTVRCGCPPDYDEDKNCLCYPSESNKVCVGDQCKSTLVVLPIFTVEDAPLNKLEMQERDSTNHNSTSTIKRSFPQVDHLKNLLRGLHFHRRRNGKANSSRPSKDQKLLKSQHTMLRYNKIPDLFTYTQQYKNHSELKFKNSRVKAVLRDVEPRKNFSNLPVLVSNYLKNKNLKILDNNNKSSSINLINKQEYEQSRKKVNNKNTTVYFNYTKDNLNFQNMKQAPKQTDEHLLDLLDKLEKEVYNEKLSEKEKEIVNNKVRSAYAALAADSDFLDKSYKFIENQHADNDHFCYHSNIPINYRRLIDKNENDLKKGLPKQRQNLININDNLKKDFTEKVYDAHHISRKLSTLLEGEKLRNTLDIHANNFNDKELLYITTKDSTNKNWNYDIDEIDNLLHYKDKDTYLRHLKNIEQNSHTYHKPNQATHSNEIEEQLKPRINEQMYQKRVNDIYMPNRAQVIYGF